MDGFTYTNIFDTKGIEYLIIIAFLLLIIPFWLLLNKPGKIRQVIGVLSDKILKIPQGIFFNKNHTWVHLEQSGYAKMGIDNLLTHLTGPIEFSVLKGEGEHVNKGDIIAALKQEEKQLFIASPISGEIKASNPIYNEKQLFTNHDPYGKGWIYTIKPKNWKDETSHCYLADEAIKWSKNELSRFKDFISMAVMKHSPDGSSIILQEGGELTDNPLLGMPKEVWDDFQSHFLN